ncbi:hypothetical protein QBC44DRAFT_366772 [Cladorrhinum sp. PSN332]|nr:hypothetical protein QBC44DRAFT_366772 [Cladorrhinum sp. PSN332]
MVCSPCFLNILHQRLLSPALSESEYTDYLLKQHSDLETFCSTTMPLTTATSSLLLGTMDLQAGVSLAQFYALNLQIVNDCTNLWHGYSYCVASVTTPDNNGWLCVDEWRGCCSVYGYMIYNFHEF